MRFVVDVNLTPEWADLLVVQGYDAVHWRDVGPVDAPDDDILARAIDECRIVITADLGFATTVAMRGLSAPSVGQLRLDNTDPRAEGDFVIRAIAAASKALDGGAILTIDPGNARLRPGIDTIP